MDQFKLAIYFRLFQFGIGIYWQPKYNVEIIIPFVRIYIGLTANANGFHAE